MAELTRDDLGLLRMTRMTRDNWDDYGLLGMTGMTTNNWGDYG